jgi:hypothetical protein
MMVNAPQDRYATAAQEDRSAQRLKLSIPAMLRPSGSKGFQTTVRDLSLSGFSATAMTRLHPGAYCWLTLPGMESMAARVAWWDNGLVGGAFERLLSPIVLENILTRWTMDRSLT